MIRWVLAWALVFRVCHEEDGMTLPNPENVDLENGIGTYIKGCISDAVKLAAFHSFFWLSKHYALL